MGHHHHPQTDAKGVGHNHPHDADHLHSHVHGESEHDRSEDLQILTANFIDGFRAAADKTSFLRISGVPFQRAGPDGLTMNLVDASIVSHWQLGTASPAFASRELVYMPFPGSMVTQRDSMTFTYVSLTHRDDVDLVDMLRQRFEEHKE